MKILLLEPESINWRQVRRFVVFFVVVSVLLYFLSQVYHALLVPFGISLLLTYLLAPFVERLDRYRIPRVLVVSGLLGLTIALITFGSIRIVPALYSELIELIRLVPSVFDSAVKKWLPFVREFVLAFDVIRPAQFDRMVADSLNLALYSDRIQQALTTIWYTVPRVVGTMVNVVMTPLMTFFLLKDFNEIRTSLLEIVPRDLQYPVRIFLTRVGATLRAVIKGQVTVALILAALYVFGLSLVGLQTAWAIGLIAGICRIIPYLDIVVGGILSLVVILSDFQGVGQLVAVTSVFLVVQTLDGMFITPRIIGEKVGLHPLIVIVSIISFADLLGFWGVLLAIPLVAVAKVLWLSAKPFYLASDAYDVENSCLRRSND